MLPQRVPMTRPSSAVKPIVESTDLPSRHGAQAGAITEMCSNDATSRKLGGQLAQPARDVFIGDAVKTVAAHAGIVKISRQGKTGRDFRHRVVEGGVETADL